MTSRDIVDLDGPVHVADHGGDGPLMVMVHGLEGSHLNWMAVAPKLTDRYRVIAPDLSGFGLTPPAGRGSTIEANAALVHDLIRKYGDGPAILVGNSMGGLVAMVAATTEPAMIDRLVMVSPALPSTRLLRGDGEALVKLGAPLLPFVGPQLVRLYRRSRTPEVHTREGLAFVCADPDTVDPLFVTAGLEMTRLRRTMAWSTGTFVEGLRSTGAYVLNRRRYRRLIHRVTQPTLVIHGEEDRLVPVAAARWVAAERPDWQVRIWPHTGHVAMIEDPERFVAEMREWLGG